MGGGVAAASSGEREAGAPEYGAATLDDMTAMVAAGAGRWGLSPRTGVRLLNISENATFLLDDPEEGRRLVLRLHRIGYHSLPEIRSELAWIDALREGGVVDTPAVIATADGERVVTLASPGGFSARQAVAFDFAEGREPAPTDALEPWFRALGAITARMQAQARAWQRPAGFVRKTWDFDAMIGARPYWGRWQDGLGLDAAGRALLARTAALIGRRLAAFGTGPDRFGLVHADLRLANLLVDGDRLTVIDFDDCGLSWFAYDFAAAVSFFEHEPVVPALMDAWAEGFRTVAPLGDDVVAELPVFVMLRRILLVAWIASHAETPTAQEMGVPYTERSLAMAEDLLTRFG